jgi:hypothetical protein
MRSRPDDQRSDTSWGTPLRNSRLSGLPDLPPASRRTITGALSDKPVKDIRSNARMA